MGNKSKSIAVIYKNTYAVQHGHTVWVYKFGNYDDVRKFTLGHNLTPSRGDSSPSPVLIVRFSLHKEYRTKLGLKFCLRKIYYKFL